MFADVGREQRREKAPVVIRLLEAATGAHRYGYDASCVNCCGEVWICARIYGRVSDVQRPTTL